jgi:dihydropteroate synthase
MIAKVLHSDAMDDRYWPTIALTANAREHGARIVRVHDVKPNREALRMMEAILGAV